MEIYAQLSNALTSNNSTHKHPLQLHGIKEAFLVDVVISKQQLN